MMLKDKRAIPKKELQSNIECTGMPGVGNRVRRVLLVLAAVVSVVGVAQAQTRTSAQASQMLQRYKCYFCHADNDAKTGPAFVDIAATYKGKPQASALLAAAVRKGGHGSGPWHMPPHPEVSAADAKAMVRYILSLQK